MINWLVVTLSLSCSLTGLACASSQDVIRVLLEMQRRAGWDRLWRRHTKLRSFWRLYALGMAILAVGQSLVLIVAHFR